MLNDALKGAGYLIRGVGLLTAPGVKKFVIIPLAINIILFGALIWFGYNEFNALLDWLLPAEGGWFAWLRWILVPLFFLVILVVGFFLFTFVANIVSAPFNGLLAEAVERHLTGKEVGEPKGLLHIIKNALPMVWNEVKKLGYFMLLLVPAFLLFIILSFIPVINIIASIGWFLLTAWVIAVEYNDYPHDNHDISFRQLRTNLGRRKGLAFGFGGLTMLVTAIPIINFFIVPSAVAGATALSVEQLFNSNEK